MPYCRLEDSAPDHPKIQKLAKRMKVTEAQALGHMCALWAWCVRMAPDGRLDNFDHEDIAIAAKTKRDPKWFMETLIGLRLVDDHSSYLEVHGFAKRSETYNKSRQKRLERDAGKNKGLGGDVARQSHDKDTTVARQRPDVASLSPREEREEREEREVPPAPAGFALEQPSKKKKPAKKTDPRKHEVVTEYKRLRGLDKYLPMASYKALDPIFAEGLTVEDVLGAVRYGLKNARKNDAGEHEVELHQLLSAAMFPKYLAASQEQAEKPKPWVEPEEKELTEEEFNRITEENLAKMRAGREAWGG